MTKMRFKKGSKIEVFSQKKDPSGCWRCGEILSGNGHTYAVRYDADMDSCGGEVIDRVPRKAMRPCPPVIDVGDVWVSDDAVEVFHSLAWRVATVVRAVSGGRYLVRLLGLHHELEVDECVMRRRLRWLDDKWVDFPKGSYEGLKHNEHSILKYDLGLVPTSGTGSGYLKDKFFSMGNIGYAQETEAVLSRSLKRTNPFQHSGTESHARPYQKVRVDEKDRTRLRLIFAQPPLPKSKVDAVASLRKKEGENCINSSFYDRLKGHSKMPLQRAVTNEAVGCSHAMNLESGDDSVMSSVGSCDSLGNPSKKLPNAFSRYPFEDSDRDSSSAESSNQTGDEEENNFLHTEETLREEIHSLELNAYRDVIKAFKAMGPLTWDRVALLTDLRCQLNISDHEYLMELRRLVSSSTSIVTR